MNKNIPIAALLLLTSFYCKAQYKWAVDLGFGGALRPHGEKYTHSSGSSQVVFVPGARILFNTPRPFIFGFAATLESNRFQVGLTDSHSNVFVDQKSTYLSIAPVLGLSAGQHKMLQFNMLPCVSILLSGKQQNYSSMYVGGPTGNEYDTLNTGVEKARVGLGFEVQEQIPVSRYWRITATESMKFYFVRIGETGDPLDLSVYSNFWSIRLGVQHRRRNSS